MSDLAPNLVMTKSRFGKTGGLMRARILGTSVCQASSDQPYARCGSTMAPAVPIARDLMKSRLFNIVIFACACFMFQMFRCFICFRCFISHLVDDSQR